jgi:beta-phosphoglucomutase-like phosphatase (HAD superfamily)
MPFQDKTMSDVCWEVSQSIGVEIDRSEIRNDLTHALRSGVNAIDGNENLVVTLIEQAFPVCVASNGTLEKMHTTLSQTRLMPVLKDVLFSADQVEHRETGT